MVSTSILTDNSSTTQRCHALINYFGSYIFEGITTQKPRVGPSFVPYSRILLEKNIDQIGHEFETNYYRDRIRQCQLLGLLFQGMYESRGGGSRDSPLFVEHFVGMELHYNSGLWVLAGDTEDVVQVPRDFGHYTEFNCEKYVESHTLAWHIAPEGIGFRILPEAHLISIKTLEDVRRILV